MLAPLRDYLRPKDPASSPLLHTTKDQYFSRLSVDISPGQPGYQEARWIRSEDVNVEYLLDVFTSIDADAVNTWDACAYFMRHLRWHKCRLVMLGPKVEGLPDDHPSKARCLFQLSRIFGSVGNNVEYKRLLVYTLGLWRERGDDFQVAETLHSLSYANQQLGLYREAIQHTREALGVLERLDDRLGQAHCWKRLAWSLHHDKQLDAAEEAALRAIDLSDETNQLVVSQCYRLLGGICLSRGETGKAINHYEKALEIASSFGWHYELFSNNQSLARLFFSKERFNDAHVCVERAKLHATNDPYKLGLAVK